jgi:hypothetical protein
LFESFAVSVRTLRTGPANPSLSLSVSGVRLKRETPGRADGKDRLLSAKTDELPETTTSSIVRVRFIRFNIGFKLLNFVFVSSP